MRTCKTDDVVYGISETGLAICIGRDGKLYIGSAFHAAPAADVDAIIGNNIIRDGADDEARKMSRQGLIALAIEMGQEVLVTLRACKVEALAEVA
jgi:hypothetical protein